MGTGPIWKPLKPVSARMFDYAQLIKLYGERGSASSGPLSQLECNRAT